MTTGMLPQAIPGLTAGAPLDLHTATVAKSQTNALGHLKAAEYVRLFDDAINLFFPLTGLADEDLRHGNTSPFLMDLHTCYLSELRPGEAVRIAVRHMEHDARRARLILVMTAAADGRMCATGELLLINMNMITRKPEAWSATQAAVWEQLHAAHQSLPPLPQAGRAIGALGSR
jgi:acyl-CoA thioester hydrolase